MTLLIANVVPQGLIFAADRNLSVEGITVAEQTKVLKVDEVVAGYAGRARIEGMPMCDWLRDFLRRREGAPLAELGPALAAELELAMSTVGAEARGTIVHLGGFETGSDGQPLPVIWYVRDMQLREDGKGYEHLDRFEARDELKEKGNGQHPYFFAASGDEIKRQLLDSNAALPWAGFRQSFDLTVFGTLDTYVWAFAEALAKGLAQERKHDPPTKLEHWEPYMRFSVLCYAAYFQAFYPPNEQIVGGGVDVEYVHWPV